MDAVVKGLIGGTAISLILFFAGIIGLNSGFAEIVKNPNTVGIWLIVLTSFMVGQMYITFSITTAFAEVPPQTKTST